MSVPIALLAPWSRIGGDAGELEHELRRELARGHPLFGRPIRAVARRHDRDDVLFELSEDGECAVVHLTWTGKVERLPYPTTRVFASVSAWASTAMRDDHEEFGEG